MAPTAADMTKGFGAGVLLVGNVHFETGDDRYRWLNTVHTVMRGVVVQGTDGR